MWARCGRLPVSFTRPPPLRLPAPARWLRTGRSPAALLDHYKAAFQLPPASASVQDLSAAAVGQQVTVHGYLGSRSDVSKKLSFVPLLGKTLDCSVQVISVAQPADERALLAHFKLKQLAENVPVAVSGLVQSKVKPKEPARATDIARQEDVEIKLHDITVLNDFPADIDFQESSTISSDQRHLQIRQSKALRDALAFRALLAATCRTFLATQYKFTEVETPLLFKSTPEGAREFLVPTRAKGQAYALPQSPQQYKQILMASGISRYYQIARCFRDEDLRADRQPEFTQLDLEMAFATGQDVMDCVEALVKSLWSSLLNHDLPGTPFPHLTYDDAMSRFGSDKPDTRLGSEIVRIEHMIPVDLIGKIGPLHDPIVEAFVFKCFEDAEAARGFVGRFMDSENSSVFMQNPDGQPGVFIYDPRKPLCGLQPFGFEAAEFMEQQFELEESDVVIIQARKRAPFAGGSTAIGNLRLALHRFAVSEGDKEAATGWNFLWVKQFPLFSPVSKEDPGQGGRAGIASTHHPFTAPASVEDIDKLQINPLDVKADHYDLVLNGVELGGGSRRIHVAEMQLFVLKDILQMSEERLEDFTHLIEVLRAGCPPHAGMALGFDRLCAVMLGKDSIRDVIAFPKSGSGTDALVKSPSPLTTSQLDTYHLQLKAN